MFKILSEPKFTHVVRVAVPADGGHREETLRATFRALPTSRLERYDLATEAGTTEFLRDAVVGLDDLADEHGEPLPYSDAVRDAALDLPYVRIALARVYFAAITQARAGN